MSEPEGLDEFLNAYITAALWSTNDESDDNGGEPLDKNYGEDDIAPVTLALMRADCAAFLYHKLGGRLLGIAERPEFEVNLSLPGGVGCSVMAYAGHALWLTRNGHGAGFWDGGWPKGIAEGLDKLAHDFGAFDLYVGDDGLVYAC